MTRRFSFPESDEKNEISFTGFLLMVSLLMAMINPRLSGPLNDSSTCAFKAFSEAKRSNSANWKMIILRLLHIVAKGFDKVFYFE